MAVTLQVVLDRLETLLQDFSSNKTGERTRFFSVVSAYREATAWAARYDPERYTTYQDYTFDSSTPAQALPTNYRYPRIVTNTDGYAPIDRVSKGDLRSGWWIEGSNFAVTNTFYGATVRLYYVYKPADASDVTGTLDVPSDDFDELLAAMAAYRILRVPDGTSDHAQKYAASKAMVDEVKERILSETSLRTSAETGVGNPNFYDEDI